MGDRPTGLLPAFFQKGHAPGLGDGHIGHVIPNVDGIDTKGRPLGGTGFGFDRGFTLHDLALTDVLDEGIQPRAGFVEMLTEFFYCSPRGR